MIVIKTEIFKSQVTGEAFETISQLEFHLTNTRKALIDNLSALIADAILYNQAKSTFESTKDMLTRQDHSLKKIYELNAELIQIAKYKDEGHL